MLFCKSGKTSLIGGFELQCNMCWYCVYQGYYDAGDDFPW